MERVPGRECTTCRGSPHFLLPPPLAATTKKPNAASGGGEEKRWGPTRHVLGPSRFSPLSHTPTNKKITFGVCDREARTLDPAWGVREPPKDLGPRLSYPRLQGEPQVHSLLFTLIHTVVSLPVTWIPLWGILPAVTTV